MILYKSPQTSTMPISLSRAPTELVIDLSQEVESDSREPNQVIQEVGSREREILSVTRTTPLLTNSLVRRDSILTTAATDLATVQNSSPMRMGTTSSILNEEPMSLTLNSSGTIQSSPIRTISTHADLNQIIIDDETNNQRLVHNYCLNE